DFLLRTSLGERVCAPLAAAMLGAGGERLMRVVLHANLFVVPLQDHGGGPAGRRGGETEWYRYHHLFRAALPGRLATRLGPETVQTLHARAGAWLAAEGHVDEAVTHLLAAGDVSGAADLVERSVREALDADAWPAVERWLAQLPEAAVRGRAALVLARAW